VEVRFNLLDQSKVYVWWQDRYYGEACIYVAQNDYVKRQEHLERLQQLEEEPTPPNKVYVPPYSRLERKLAEYRQEKAELDLNDALNHTLAKKEQIKAGLTPLSVTPLASLQGGAKDEGSESPF